MTDYVFLGKALSELIRDVNYDISNLANTSALIYSEMDRLNWAGFYILRNGQLELGPFQGKTACTVIGIGRGVCGTSAAEDRTVLVPDVHLFPGHIACDSASESEIVVPVHVHGTLYGVLDIDSPVKYRFTEEDRTGLEALVKILEKKLEK